MFNLHAQPGNRLDGASYADLGTMLAAVLAVEPAAEFGSVKGTIVGAGGELIATFAEDCDGHAWARVFERAISRREAQSEDHPGVPDPRRD